MNSHFTEKAENLLQKLLNKKNIHHAMLGMETGDGSFRWSSSVGEAQPDGTPMETESPYMIASVTKLFIAAAILKLYEQGVVDLDKPFTNYLPDSLSRDLHIYKGTDYTANITIRHLLSHTSGIPDWLEDRPKGGKSILENIDSEEDRLISAEEGFAFVREKLTPHFPPQDLSAKKQKIRYSDTGFQLMIAILEEQTGKPIHQVFDEFIYQPAGMTQTFFEENFPEGYPKPATFWVGKEVFSQPLLLRSFHDLYSSLDDQLKFMKALIKGTFFENPETSKLMQQHWNRFGFPFDPATIHQPSWPIEYGLGMMRFEIPRFLTPFKPIPAFVGHTGVLGSWLFYCPEYDLYLAGTVGQITAAPVPFRFVPKLLRLYGSTL